MQHIVLESKKLIVLFSSKCGSTSLKHLLLRYELGMGDLDMFDIDVHLGWDKLLPGSKDYDVYIDDSYSCLSLTRNPLDRLISAFASKYPFGDDPTYAEVCNMLVRYQYDNHFALQTSGIGWHVLTKYKAMGGRHINQFSVSQFSDLNRCLLGYYPNYSKANRDSPPHSNHRTGRHQVTSDARPSELKGLSYDSNGLKQDSKLNALVYEFYRQDYELLGYEKY